MVLRPTNPLYPFSLSLVLQQGPCSGNSINIRKLSNCFYLNSRFWSIQMVSVTELESNTVTVGFSEQTKWAGLFMQPLPLRSPVMSFARCYCKANLQDLILFLCSFHYKMESVFTWRKHAINLAISYAFREGG